MNSVYPAFDHHIQVTDLKKYILTDIADIIQLHTSKSHLATQFSAGWTWWLMNDLERLRINCHLF